MARLTFTPIQQTSSASNAGNGLTLLDIPQDVRDDVEEVYAYCKANPTARMRTPEFADKNAALAWQTLATAYCALRPNGAIGFRRSPTRGLAENVFDFRIKDLPDPNATNAVRDAVEAAKATGALKAPAKR